MKIPPLTFKKVPAQHLSEKADQGSPLTSLAFLKLLPDAISLEGGDLSLRTKGGNVISLTNTSEKSMEKVRGNEIAMIFQDPMTALNPVHKVGKQMVEAILAHKGHEQGRSSRTRHQAARSCRHQ